MFSLGLSPAGAWLAAIASSLDVFVVFHAGAELDVNTWWHREPEALGDLDQIQLLHVKYGP